MQALLLLVVIAVVLTSSRALAGFVNGKPVTFEGVVIGYFAGVPLYMRKDAGEAFKRMKAAAAADGVTLQLTGLRAAFRTTKDQQLMGQTRPGYAAPVNRSPHQGGYAVDVDMLDDKGQLHAAGLWMEANAPRFGFRRTRSDEPWHWEFDA